jgi:gluconolactonase
VLDRIRVLNGELDHPEGVAWSPGGAIYAGGEAGQVYRITLDGDAVVVGSTEGFAYGVTLDGDDRAYVCDFARAQLCRVSPDGSVTTVTDGTPERPMRVPNFSAFDDDGTLFVTDSGAWGDDAGVVYAVRPDGDTRVWSDAVPRFPNGCCLTPDGGALLVVESTARRVVRVPIGLGGNAGAPSTVVELPGSQPDGIALAADGETLVVGCYRPDRLYVVDPAGRVDVLADDPDGVSLNQPTNVAFVGDDLTTLAISSLGGWSISLFDAGLAGLPLRRPRLA